MMKTWRCVLIVATAISFVPVAGAAGYDKVALWAPRRKARNTGCGK